MTSSLKKVEKQFDRIAIAAYKHFKSITPKRTGNARRRTRLQGNTIKANYSYARQLDNGSSAQAPNGMSEPTIKWLRKNKRKFIRK